jgi:hypothetical protein
MRSVIPEGLELSKKTDDLCAGIFPRTWRKIEIIHLSNRSRIANQRGLHYPESRFGNRRLDVIVREIAALLKQGS